MLNLRMQEKLEAGEALAVEDVGEPTPDGRWKLRSFTEDVDYCVRSTESWIWSIGRHKQTGEIHASTSSEFYQHPEYTCLFLR